MSDKFTVEIITPEKSLLSLETKEVTIPSYEGEIGILRDHIPLITFLRPGIISIQDQKNKKFYVEEGTVEFLKNNLLILTSTARDLTNLSQDSIENLLKQEENRLSKNNFSDKEKYLISHKISTLKEINQ
jgi:ATP synthase F1 epsilon subunit|tara:strand:+ start:223 stop:612 length:390 start_codon:yes stop_codon:yes gene_type:complete